MTDEGLSNESKLNNNIFSADTMDFSGMSLIKLKKEEMESQVKLACSAFITSVEILF